MFYMETNVNPVFLVLMLMISQKIDAATYTPGYETPHGAGHAKIVTTTTILDIQTFDTQSPPTTVAPEKGPGTVGVSKPPISLFPMRD